MAGVPARACADCRADISDRVRWARLCRGCAAARQVKRNKWRFALLVADPAKHERQKAYQRDWDRQRSAARPDKTAVCPGCFKTFVQNRNGAPRTYCRECAVMFAKDRKSVAYRKWYRANRARQIARMAVYRASKRRAA